MAVDFQNINTNIVFFALCLFGGICVMCLTFLDPPKKQEGRLSVGLSIFTVIVGTAISLIGAINLLALYSTKDVRGIIVRETTKQYEGFILRSFKATCQVERKLKIFLFETPGVKTVNFDDLLHLENSIKQIVMLTLPDGFAKNLAGGIVFDDMYIPMPQVCGKNTGKRPEELRPVAQKIPGVEYLYARTSGSTQTITMTKEVRTENPKYTLGFALLHEMSHLNDPTDNRLLTLKEKYELAAKVIARITADNRFIDDYVESYISPDAKEENSQRASEYFAVIMTEYLNCRPLPKEDEEICRELVFKMDPFFDVKRAREARMIILSSQIGRPH